MIQNNIDFGPLRRGQINLVDPPVAIAERIVVAVLIAIAILIRQVVGVRADRKSATDGEVVTRHERRQLSQMV